MPTVSEDSARDPASDQPIIRDLRRALRGDSPLDLLALISSLLQLTDPRRLSDPDHELPKTSLESLVDSFVGTDLAETTAALHVISALVPDDLLRARIRKALGARTQPMPAWVTDLDSAEVTRVELMTHVLGDGDNYLLEVRFAGGERISPIVYVDHNLGTVVKDAFVIPESLDAVVDRYEHLMEEDQSIDPHDPSLARAELTQAIENGDKLFPPLESDEWPQCRPLVEWVVRRLPIGEGLAEAVEWSDESLSELIDGFFGSDRGRALDGPQAHHLLQMLVQFGLEVGPGDPLRWSPVNVEILLTDWWPPRLADDQSEPDQALSLLRAWIRWCHGRRRLREVHTIDTLSAVDSWEPAFRALVKSSSALSDVQARIDILSSGALGDPAVGEIMLESIDRAVGGRAVTMALTDDPLPDEPFDWSGVPEDVQERLREVVDLVDGCCAEILDVEHRTAARRLLARSVAADPGSSGDEEHPSGLPPRFAGSSAAPTTPSPATAARWRVRSSSTGSAYVVRSRNALTCSSPRSGSTRTDGTAPWTSGAPTTSSASVAGT